MAPAVEVTFREVAREERRAAALDMTIREYGHTRSSARLLDVSRSGCKLEANFALRAGTLIWVNLPGLSGQAARVVWARGYTVGCRFLAPLHPAVLQTLLPAR